VQLRSHQSASNRRIFLHELFRGLFIGCLKNGNAKCLVAWFRCAPRKNQLTAFGGLLKANEWRSSAALSSFVQAESACSRGTSLNT
jgi:hypothetical protein